MKSSRRLLNPVSVVLACLAFLLYAAATVPGEPGAASPAPLSAPPATEGPNNAPGVPEGFRGRGRLVCLAEEMKSRFEAEVAPVHAHLEGFRLEKRLGVAAEDSPVCPLGYYTILRTAHSEALFVDKRFAEHTLILWGRVFPGTGLLEVTGWQWERDGRTFDVYYWCDVCSIRGFTPGSCACCQGDVELRQEAVSGAK